MNVTIYLPDDLGEKAKKEEVNISAACQREITRELANRQAERSARKKAKFQRIEVEVGDPHCADVPMLTKAFQGQWLLTDFEFNPKGWRTLSEGDNYLFSVALTKGGKFAVYVQAGVDPQAGGESWLRVYDSLADAPDNEVPQEVVALTAAQIGVKHVIELDI
jgi:hypothetical protein